MGKKWWKNHQNSHFSTLWRQSDFGHYFFQYFSLAEPSNWLLVDLKKTKFKNFQKIDQIFKKNFLNLCHGSKKATRTLLNGSGVSVVHWVPQFIGHNKNFLGSVHTISHNSVLLLPLWRRIAITNCNVQNYIPIQFLQS